MIAYAIIAVCVFLFLYTLLYLWVEAFGHTIEIPVHDRLGGGTIRIVPSREA